MLRAPTHVQLELTDKCNLRCRHCYRFDTEQMPKSNDLGESEIILLVQKIIQAKVYSLVITGGEPLARPSLAIKAASLAKQAGLFVSINTNLLLLDLESIHDLASLKVDSLLISCPASDPVIYRQITRCGNYNRLCQKIRLALDSGISCMVNMVVTPANYKLIRSTATDLSRLGIKRFAATPASLNVEHPNYEELLNGDQTVGLIEDLRWCKEYLGLEVDILEPMPKCFFPDWCYDRHYLFTKRACQAGRMSVSISNIGEVRPCSHNPVSYGNMFHETLEQIWSRMELYRINSIPATCKSCPVLSSCHGACRTNSLASTGLLNCADRLTKGHFNQPISSKTIALNHDSIICFKGNLRWRSEGTDYSITTKKNAGNLMIVNEELFRFIKWLEKIPSIRAKELLPINGGDLEWKDLARIIQILADKEFIHISNQ